MPTNVHLMIEDCIIHFGLHKTGSSSIQWFLRHELRDERFFYPASGQLPHLLDNCHNRSLCCAFQDNPEKYHIHLKEGVGLTRLRARGEWFKKQIGTVTALRKVKTLILSAEELSNHSASELERLKDFLGGHGLTVRAIGYVRKYKQLQESRFQQALREPGTRRLPLSPEAPRFTNFPYREKLEKFPEVFGHSSVQVEKFEIAASSDGGVVGDFCRKAGIAQQPRSTAQQNEGLSMHAIRLLYVFRKFGSASSRVVEPIHANLRLIDKLSELKGDRVAFHSSLVRKSEHQWRIDVDWISQQMGDDMVGDLYGADDRDCLRGEADLFVFSLPSLEWLASESQTQFSELKSGAPHVVAESVGLLAKRLMRRAKIRRIQRRLVSFLPKLWGSKT